MKRWTSEVGAESELIACADLLRRGWHVFRSVSPSSPCDLVIVKHGGILRVEVKTGNPVNKGKRSVPKQDELMAKMILEDRGILPARPVRAAV